MCMKNNEKESCEVATNLAALAGRVDSVEKRMDKMEGSISVGFTQVNTAVQQLATDFGTRMNTLDQRIVEEKAKWGAVLRRIVLWGAGTMLVLALAAAGINALPQIVKAFAAP